jgi:hypothetical protein
VLTLSKSVWSQCDLKFGFYDSFLDETTQNIETRDIRTMLKYPQKIDEVINAMDLIVVVWMVLKWGKK